MTGRSRCPARDPSADPNWQIRVGAAFDFVDNSELARDVQKVASDWHLVVKPGPSSFPLGSVPGGLNSVVFLDWGTPGKFNPSLFH